MVRSSKRTLEEIARADDSNDEDYDDQAPAQSRTRTNRAKSAGRLRKKQRRGGYRGSDIDSEGDELDSEEEGSYDEEPEEEEEPETDRKGRPIRKTAKKTITYEEASDDEEEEVRSESEEESKASVKLRKRLVVTLKTTPQPTRTLRNRSGSYGIKQPASVEPRSAPIRRSSRLSHEAEEPLVALTNSGHHIEVTREGSRDPEVVPPRATRGGKGIKHPSKSTIDEEQESIQTKQEEPDELEIKASQHEVMESDHQTQGEAEEQGEMPKLLSDIQQDAEAEDEPERVTDSPGPLQINVENVDDEEDDDMPVTRGRTTRAAAKRKATSEPPDSPRDAKQARRSLRSGASQPKSTSRRRKAQDESSDFDPEDEQEREDALSSSDDPDQSPKKISQRNDDYDSSNNGRRSRRIASKVASRQRSPVSDEDDDLAAEVAELKRDGKKPRLVRDEITFEPRGRRGVKKQNYDLLRNLAPIEDEDEAPAAPSPSRGARRGGGGGWQRSLFNTYGPFGGAGGPTPVLGGPLPRAQGDVDSDSSDDETMKQPRPSAAAVAMTPTAAGTFNLFPQPLNADAAQGPAGTPANLGKIKDKQALADADPLGVDQHVNFDGVGGLQGHIDQLKEMVALPLLYPEIFERFKITPPRGVLFHGPPGTGKTLLARALASSVSSQGRKVTFYMRKGADALSKWVGEAERQLRLLFDEARKTQPSIIFFDEIDGLAPVRSSKQEQIHASIVSTLLALMDGMDGRGQVIVIGATNRPDSIDPALRRPGRFDREFYFPLPNTEARRAILDIHTKGWNPPLAPTIKDELAEMTKGYGGADLRALCTEAALNAVQRRYPQIYASSEKLLIDAKTIEVTAKDFMISIKKMVPSSERSASSGASPLPSTISPLLMRPVTEIKHRLNEIMPQKKRLTALEEAQFEDVADGHSFGRERMQQAFESLRVFRPRLLIAGKFGMGQQYVAAALLHHFEGLHVQNFDLPTLIGDTASTPEATVVRLFSEAKMHKPSVIYIPNVQEWYATVGPTVISTFLGLLRSIKPTDPILLLGILEDDEGPDEAVRRDLFGYSNKNKYILSLPLPTERVEFFQPLKAYVKTSPKDFPDPQNRKKRMIPDLPPAPLAPVKPLAPLSKEEQKAQKKRDRQTLNMLKIRLQPIMDQIRTRYKKFRTGVIDESQIRYLYDEADPGTVTSDLPHDIRARATFRPFEISKDAHGVPGLLEQGTGNFYYNLDSVTIEKRLSNGYYKRPKDFLGDIKRLARDAKTVGDEDRLLRANELLANVEVDIAGIELGEPAFNAECERVYQRELEREKEAAQKAKSDAEANKEMPPPHIVSNIPPPHGPSGPSTSNVSMGAIQLGEPTNRQPDILSRFQPATPSRPLSDASAQTNGVHTEPTQARSGSLTNGTGTNDGNQADVEDTAMAGMNSNETSKEKSNETQKTHTTSSHGNRESAQPRPIHMLTGPSQRLREEHGMSEPLSQTGIITPMRTGSQAADYQNEASTTDTTSGAKKNSDGSSGERGYHSTQDTGPQMLGFDADLASDLPNTQQDSLPRSQPSNGHPSQPRIRGPSQPHDRSSQPPVPLFDEEAAHKSQPERRKSDVHDLLSPDLPQDAEIDVAIQQFANESHKRQLTVEQMEQVNSVLMDMLWQTRSEWDRRMVLNELKKAFQEVIHDMKDAGQEVKSLDSTQVSTQGSAL